MKSSIKRASVLCAAAFICSVFGCAPNQAPESPGGAEANGDAAALVSWSEEVDCSTCHASEAASMIDAETAAFLHGEEGDTCVTCHADVAALAHVHEGVSADGLAPSGLVATEVGEEGCVECHETEALAAKTTESTALVDAQGTIVNPHRLPEVPDHASITCADCHKMHAAEAPEETAQDKCAICHHQNVFECYTCHE